MRRHTPSTIGPCRRTRAANAASSRPRDEALQQLCVGAAVVARPQQPSQLPHGPVHRPRRHCFRPPTFPFILPIRVAARRCFSSPTRLRTDFSRYYLRNSSAAPQPGRASAGPAAPSIVRKSKRFGSRSGVSSAQRSGAETVAAGVARSYIRRHDVFAAHVLQHVHVDAAVALGLADLQVACSGSASVSRSATDRAQVRASSYPPSACQGVSTCNPDLPDVFTTASAPSSSAARATVGRSR